METVGNRGRPLGSRHDEKTRKKIQTSQIINRLTNHILGKDEMSSSQVRAAEILLNKTLPNLAATHNTDSVAKTLEDWLEELDERDKPNSEAA